MNIIERKCLREFLRVLHRGGKLLLLKCNTRRDLLNQQGWKCTLSKSTKLISRQRILRENVFFKMNDWSQIYLQHSTSQCWKGNLHRNCFKRNLAEKNRHCNPFQAKSFQQAHWWKQRYVLFTDLVKIFHGAVAISNQPHPCFEFQRYYFGTQCNRVFCDLVFE